MESQIRLAKKGDALKILELLNSAEEFKGSEDDLPYNSTDIEEYLSLNLIKIFVYEVNRKIVGLALTQFWKTHVYFNMLIVEQKFRNKGIANALIEYIEKESQKNQKELIWMFTEEDNIKIQKLLEKKNYKKGKKFLFYSKKLEPHK